MPALAIEFDDDLIETTLAPYLVESRSLPDAEWEADRARLARKWASRRRRRRLLGLLPGPLRRSIASGGRRTTEHVREAYEDIWTERPVQAADAPLDHKPILAEWRDRGLRVRRGALPRVHLVLMARMIEELKPASVLEVGCGDGRNLFAMASRFPDIAFRGIELSEAGVRSGRRSQEAPTLPPHLRSFTPWEPADDTAFRRVELTNGNAMAMPFEDDAVDLVMTHLALEQMNPIREEVMAEISRVARRNVLFLEPFADFNRTPLQRDFVEASDYLSMPLADLPRFGIRVTATSEAFPQKSRLGQGPIAHSCLVEVERYEGTPPPVTAFEPPEIMKAG